MLREIREEYLADGLLESALRGYQSGVGGGEQVLDAAQLVVVKELLALQETFGLKVKLELERDAADCRRAKQSH